MDIVGLRGDRVRLVPAEPARHLENALHWLNDPAVVACLDQFCGVTRRQEEAFFEHATTRRDADLHWAILDPDGRHVGFIGLHQIDWRNRSASGGIVLGERDAWGKGFATDAVRTRTRFAFDQLGLHRIEGHTINPAMRRVYEKCGYRHEGTARQKRWRDGAWRDVALYAILDVDYAQGPIPGTRAGN
jgi:RimJ/RimL family protein N-acetyltransferase